MHRRWLYLVLFVLGCVLPMTQFVPWVRGHGMDLPLFTQELFASRISSFFAIDLVITAVVVITMARAERGRVRLWWLPIVLTVGVGVSAGLPLLLFLRELAPAETGGL